MITQINFTNTQIEDKEWIVINMCKSLYDSPKNNYKQHYYKLAVPKESSKLLTKETVNSSCSFYELSNSLRITGNLNALMCQIIKYKIPYKLSGEIKLRHTAALMQEL